MAEICDEEVFYGDRCFSGFPEEESGKLNKNKHEKKQKKRGMKRGIKAAIILLSIFVFLGYSYLLVAFGSVPFIKKWRNIWIETAMTTDQHQWLATSFFPKKIIDEVMGAQIDVRTIAKTDLQTDAAAAEQNSDILGQKNLTVGEKDANGNTVLVNDIEQGIVILEVKTNDYVGRLTLVDDPSRVFMGVTDRKGVRGKFICDYLSEYNAVVGVNASGFDDPEGHGIGGVVTGQCITQGIKWGTYTSRYTTVGLDRSNRLVVGSFSDWDDYNLRDAFEYHPALILNGKVVIDDVSGGWGLQPRTVIGQRKDGVIMFFVADGRKIGYSIGATMGDCAKVLATYGAVTAGACDGGSSSVLAYDGKILNKPSTNMPTGRYLPNAWLVKRK